MTKVVEISAKSELNTKLNLPIDLYVYIYIPVVAVSGASNFLL